ncbi:MAG TPA: acyltransferase family protein, partial [Usitatibacter sp.]|nr:acyltransferase family protein [Usitatibacter sp.]
MNRGAKPRYLLLDGLRGMAALVIVVHHFTALSGQREIFASASIAVDFFFCLGGFVIAHAYQERLLAGMSALEYTRRRVARLYPMYLVGLAIGLFALALGKT